MSDAKHDNKQNKALQGSGENKDTSSNVYLLTICMTLTLTDIPHQKIHTLLLVCLLVFP